MNYIINTAKIASVLFVIALAFGVGSYFVSTPVHAQYDDLGDSGCSDCSGDSGSGILFDDFYDDLGDSGCEDCGEWLPYDDEDYDTANDTCYSGCSGGWTPDYGYNTNSTPSQQSYTNWQPNYSYNNYTPSNQQSNYTNWEADYSYDEEYYEETVTNEYTYNYDNHESNLSCDLHASSNNVREGQNVTLTWNTNDAKAVYIDNGIGNVSKSGSKSVSIDHDTTFTLTAQNKNDSEDCTVHINVEKKVNHTNDNLRCELKASDRSIDEGDRVTLSWDNEDTEDITLEDDHNHTIIDTDDGDNYDADHDSIIVKPTKDTEYTLTAINGNDEDECTVTVNVDDNNDDVTVVTHRDQQPYVIALNDVPYTGFDAGPYLTSIFYVLLALWGIGVAYFLVVKRGKVFATKTNGENVQTTFVPSIAAPSAVAAVDAPEQTMSDVLEQHAHTANVLLSSDALAYVAQHSASLEENIAFLDTVIANVKSKFPSEDGWTVINKERLVTLVA